MPYLTIAIPTYNRAHKLRQLLIDICGQINRSAGLQEKVEIIVSDNASSDKTPEILSSFTPNKTKFRHYRQASNLGPVKNMRFLYQESRADYVWYFADDDILFDGAVEKVVNALEAESPEALLFSFRQPPDSPVRTFDFPQALSVFDVPDDMIKLLCRWPKISIYVLKRIELSQEDISVLQLTDGTGFDFVAVAYTILQKADSPRVCVISEPLAGCDPDFVRIRFNPEEWGQGWIVFSHPYVKMHAPHLEKSERRRSYYNQIQALFAVKAGTLTVEDVASYDRFISKLTICPLWLLAKPRSLFQMLLLKLKCSHYWPVLKKIIHRGS